MDILWQGLQSGVLQTVATDHIAWTREQKQSSHMVDELLPGMSHLETLLPLLYSDGVQPGKAVWDVSAKGRDHYLAGARRKMR
jgi:dihydropyrimidinase